jgi:hypothetical protein
MNKITLTAALIAITMSTAAMAADWVLVTSTDTGDRYVDRTSIKQVGPYKRAWDKIVWNNDPKYKETAVLTEYDCAGGRSREIQLTVYYQNGENISGDGDDWKYVTPDTNFEAMLNYICFGKLPE